MTFVVFKHSAQDILPPDLQISHHRKVGSCGNGLLHVFSPIIVHELLVLGFQGLEVAPLLVDLAGAQNEDVQGNGAHGTSQRHYEGSDALSTGSYGSRTPNVSS